MTARTLLAIAGCLVLALSESDVSAQDSAESKSSPWVGEQLESMSLAEKVGQLIVAGTPTGYTSVDSADFEEIKRDIVDYHVGGYHAFRGDVYSAAFLIRRMQEVAKIPLLITADLEGGTGLIFEGGTRFPKAMALGALADADAVRRVAEITAREGVAMGIHVNFYPVVDVNNNPENPIINIRSFGEDPQEVGRLAAAYIQGAQSQGMLATAKHFPGHGDTALDSHLELPLIEASLERLEAVELPPFRAALKAGAAAVMTAHLAVPALEPDRRLPATLSPRILGGLLRGQMGFEGLIFTDAMNMKGIIGGFSDGEAAVRAILAGADLILYPISVPRTYQGLMNAVRAGRISRPRLDASVQRILEAKARLRLDDHHPPDLEQIDKIVGTKAHKDEAQAIMDRAVTIVRDDRGSLPFRLNRNSTLLVLTLLDRQRRFEPRGAAFFGTLRSHHHRSIHFEIGPDASTNEIRLVKELAARVGAVAIGAYIQIASFKGDISLSQNQVRLLRDLSELKLPTALAVFGSPYLLAAIPETPSYIVAYDDHPGAEEAVAKAILGKSVPRGRPPINLTGLPSVKDHPRKP